MDWQKCWERLLFLCFGIQIGLFMQDEHLTVHVFCDFDGTITKKDSGDEFFKQFSDFEPYHTQLMDGLLTVTSYYNEVVQKLKHNLDEQAIRNFADACETDMYFPQFVSLINSYGWNLHIVSDGFRTYIEPILQRILPNDSINVFSNNIISPLSRLNPTQDWKAHYPFADESCTCFCASCKRNIVLSSVHPDALIIYIGDGLSDTCPVTFADMVFAKGKLAAFCNTNGILHHSWHTFFDIITVLKKRKPVKRDIAKKNRQKAFEQE